MSENCTHDCSSCGENCPSREANPADFLEKPNAMSHIKKVIGVVSGKGGVGKSMVTSMLAVLLNRRGARILRCWMQILPVLPFQKHLGFIRRPWAANLAFCQHVLRRGLILCRSTSCWTTKQHQWYGVGPSLPIQ